MDMKLSNRQVDELITNIAGDDVPPLITLLKNRKNVSEFKLADELNITVNQIRNMLYRLHKHNLVHFIRKKDKKKGWYIYYWTLHLNNTKQALLGFKRQQLEDFQSRLLREEDGIFYVCPNRCIRYKIEGAMENEFRCNECGELVREQDNSRTISNIKARIKDIQVEVANAEAFETRKYALAGKKPVVRKSKKKTAKRKVARVAVGGARMVKKKAVKKKPVKKKKAVKKKAKKKPAKKKAHKRKPAKKAKKKAVKRKPVKKKAAKKKAPKKKPVKKKAVKKKPAKKAVKKKPVKKVVKKAAPKKKRSLLKRVFSRKK